MSQGNGIVSFTHRLLITHSRIHCQSKKYSVSTYCMSGCTKRKSLFSTETKNYNSIKLPQKPAERAPSKTSQTAHPCSPGDHCPHKAEARGTGAGSCQRAHAVVVTPTCSHGEGLVASCRLRLSSAKPPRTRRQDLWADIVRRTDVQGSRPSKREQWL